MGGDEDSGEHAKGPVLGTVEGTHRSSVGTPFRLGMKTIENSPLLSHQRRVVAFTRTGSNTFEDDWTGQMEKESRVILRRIAPLVAPSSPNTTSESTKFAPQPRSPRQAHHRQHSLRSTRNPRNPPSRSIYPLPRRRKSFAGGSPALQPMLSRTASRQRGGGGCVSSMLGWFRVK
ncbi:hypothetical protein BKA70DRAFT_345497 [Coprinopsis sp. MPI-PUGE-AT-0042]|nr:hypothetical protein BKA70DRAFT_369347 [Coprinopsis sp. MPI-PUGE-AT-0042]KAH6907794.1 hypothetical protein BKA70DRAFT_345497 [Coprinopsis sp. MPI-PUGE-AT-0042]